LNESQTIVLGTTEGLGGIVLVVFILVWLTVLFTQGRNK
jgi:hypothetical protein